ncbi:MAG: cbb3-type cytochrome c oxidase subunit I [Flavobacteriales bacterium]|nr:cbb3-type cytochrome c oxidase subunit I [Flavobacteriales bacterium]
MSAPEQHPHDERTVLRYLMTPRNWWLPLLVIFLISAGGVMFIGHQTYQDAPPIADMVDEGGTLIISGEAIRDGQEVFLRYGLMEYGSMFGDGGGRGPDFTAEALHRAAKSMQAHHARAWEQQHGQPPGEREQRMIVADVQQELKKDRYDPGNQRITLTPAQVHAVNDLREHNLRRFTTEARAGSFPPPGFISDPNELKALSDFFFWGGWVCVTERPGATYSYTHNWPYDPEAGNVPSAPVMWWSVIGILGFILGLGITMYYHGQLDKLSTAYYAEDAAPLMTKAHVDAYQPTPTQRATYKFFLAAFLVFLVQVLSGALTIAEFTDFLQFAGIDLSSLIPLVVSRSWHLMLALYWISACWIGCSIFLLPLLAGTEVRGQLRLVNTLFGLLLVLVAGTILGTYAGPMGLLHDAWALLGHQGWEFVELGRVMQGLLLIVLVLWAVIVHRGCKPAFRKGRPWALPNWLVYSTVSISVLLLSGFVAGPRTNFVIADFWRWAVIHMWVEAFFEVFTTIVAGYLLVRMGLVGQRSVVRVIYLATLLFLGSGLLGISHNFYWNAKPVATMALGSVFSTLQVVPLVLLTLEAWRFSRMGRSGATRLRNGADEADSFGQAEVFLFLLAVNFWNFMGAGVLGLIINLPAINYYEHGTYLTVNHAHAALFGVYGNLSIAGALFCCRLLLSGSAWNGKLLRTSFWSLNIGLSMMVVMDLLPAGLVQLKSVLEHGLWYARSEVFITGGLFASLTWLRGLGATLFILGGVAPLCYFILRSTSGRRSPQVPDATG